MKFLVQSKVLWQIVIVQLAVSSKQFELQIACVMFACFISHLGKIQLYEMRNFNAAAYEAVWMNNVHEYMEQCTNPTLLFQGTFHKQSILVCK